LGQRDETYSVDGIMGTLSATDYKQPKQIYVDNQIEPNIIKEDIQLQVKVRKFNGSPVSFQDMIRSFKTLSNQEIANRLGIQKTEVDHWFRTDSCFSYPRPELWAEIKNTLGINTDEFDSEVMDFEIRDGVFEKANRVYHTHGIALTTASEEKIFEQIVCEQRADEGLRFFKDDCVGTLRTIDAGGDKRVLEPMLIKNATKQGYIEAYPGDGINLQYPDSETRRGRVQPSMSPTLMCNDQIGTIENSYRIRKLTPKECWRLMGVDDVSFHRAEKYNSNSALYKQAGNSIVVDVLEAIFKQIRDLNIL
jgi:DNA (cytosine-5)-methyltransferase 1